MVRRFDDYLVRAHPVHFVVEAFTLAIERALDAQRGKLVGHDAELPGGAAVAVGGDLGRGAVFVAGAVRAYAAAFEEDGVARESAGRLERSVEMITQPPVTGSLRSSGTATPVQSFGRETQFVASARSKRDIAQVRYLRRAGQEHRHDVETGLVPGDLGMAGVIPGGAQHSPQLVRSDRPVGCAELVASPGLHFDEHQPVASQPIRSISPAPDSVR